MQANGSTPSAQNDASALRRTTVIFSVTNKPGALEEVLRAVNKSTGISLDRIESRPSRSATLDYDFFIDFTAETAKTEALVAAISPLVQLVSVVAEDKVMPWFPRKIGDLDEFAAKVLEMGEELSADHPGFTDPAYRERRQKIAEIARTYKHGQQIPRIEYTEDETRTWGAVYSRLTEMYKTHACREHCYIFPLLEQNCGYRADNIPQLEDVSKFLKDCTGFSLRPVTGLLTSRDFLNGLAFRVFHATQYIRHHSVPLYTPEPYVLRGKLITSC